MRSARPEAKIGAVYEWTGFGRLVERSVLDADVTGLDATGTAAEAARFIAEERPALTFVHLDHVDHAGHAEGHGSPAYHAAIARADSLIGVILAAVRAAGIAERTVVLVTSDHGGVGRGHGGDSMAELEIPFLLAGAGVKRGYEIRQPVGTVDNAPTVAFALGIDPPYAWIGRPVRAAFEGLEEPDLGGDPPIRETPVITAGAAALTGGLFIGTAPRVELRGPEGTPIRYTVDGSEPTAASPLYTAPFSLDRTAVVRARVEAEDGRLRRTVDASFRVVGAGTRPGLRFRYYELDELEALPAFDRLRPARSGEAYEFTLDAVRPRGDGFAVVFDGGLQIEEPGRYLFCTASDDGSRLWIGSGVVVDNDGSHGLRERCGDVTLEAGVHPVRVGYFQGAGGTDLVATYEGPGLPRQVIPADRLGPLP